MLKVGGSLSRWSRQQVDKRQLDVADKVAQVSLEGSSEGGRSDRTFVKDKSAQLEAKLERENQKKLVSHEDHWSMWNSMLMFFFEPVFSRDSKARWKNKEEMRDHCTWLGSLW